MKPLHKGEPTDAQLRWMRAIHQFWSIAQWYPGTDDLIELLGLAAASTNAVKEMLERLERDGYVEWPLNKPRARAKPKSDRLCRRANSIRLTARGLQVLEENR